jgi:predicted transcriptional regulator
MTDARPHAAATTAAVPAPTERELEVLKILWDLGSASVREVYDVMRRREDLAQNTVQTFLRMMEEKGLVSHKTEGRTFIYQPLYTRERTLSRFLNRVFDGAVDQLVMNALRVKKLSEGEMDALERIVRDARKAAKGK